MQDVGRFLRLQGAIQAALDSIPMDQAVVAEQPMKDAYLRLRAETRSVIPGETLEEFDRMFPTEVKVGPTGSSRMVIRAARFNAARSLLGSLAGWLDGFVQEARMTIEAEAYAHARVEEERGVGFRPPRT